MSEYQGYTIYEPKVYGTTSTLRINQHTEDRIDSKTIKLIKKHGFRSKDPKDITIYVAKTEFFKKDSYSSYLGHTMFWSFDKLLALEMSKQLAIQRIDEITLDKIRRKQWLDDARKPVSVKSYKRGK